MVLARRGVKGTARERLRRFLRADSVDVEHDETHVSYGG